MACFSKRQKEDDIRADQKWDFISLNDFKSNTCLAPFAYAYLWGTLVVSVAVYGVDTFTAVNLLAFDRWSGSIEPAIPLEISKWIFSACIMASWINVGFEHLRARRVIKRGAVAESYLDSLAVRLQCIRPGKNGRGWRRFLVFAELTKSKKGTEYVALFTYFSFQAWIRIIFCQGPRQVVNALTLYAVFRADLNPTEAGDVGSAFVQFFQNIGILADQQHQQAVILSGMLFTLVIWIFGALSLILATLFYVFFLWHYIPKQDGGISGYCERKINHRLAKIVSTKVNKAIEKEERQRLRADAKAGKNGEKPPVARQATVPTLFNSSGDDKLPNMPILNRTDTMSSTYSSRPGTPSGRPTIPAFELTDLEKRPGSSRTGSGTSFAPTAGLMSNASGMGYGRAASPAPSLQPFDVGLRGPQRTMTGSSQSSQSSRGPGLLPGILADREYTASPASYDQTPSSAQTGSQGSFGRYGPPMPRAVQELTGRSNTPAGPAPSMGRRTPFEGGNNFSGSDYGRSSPAPSAMSRGPISPTYSAPQAYGLNVRSASASANGPSPSPSWPSGPQYRSATDPAPAARIPGSDYFNGPASPRPATPQSGYGGYGGGNPNLARVASPGFQNRASPGFGPMPGQGSYGR